MHLFVFIQQQAHPLQHPQKIPDAHWICVIMSRTNPSCFWGVSFSCAQYPSPAGWVVCQWCCRFKLLQQNYWPMPQTKGKPPIICSVDVLTKTAGSDFCHQHPSPQLSVTNFQVCIMLLTYLLMRFDAGPSRQMPCCFCEGFTNKTCHQPVLLMRCTWTFSEHACPLGCTQCRDHRYRLPLYSRTL